MQTLVSSDRRSVRILARSLARDLSAGGLGTPHLIELASALLEEATERLRAARQMNLER
ncbi:MAG: hypothetical protein KF773_05845 [Deltaproteobacteria bacterium]|nr:hypothetical protein [Deltaproteobacteria bacterium]